MSCELLINAGNYRDCVLHTECSSPDFCRERVLLLSFIYYIYVDYYFKKSQL